MPRKIRHVRRKLLCSSSGAVKSLEQGLPLDAKFRHSKLWRPCSIHILKTPFFGSVSPLCKYTVIYGVYIRFWPTLLVTRVTPRCCNPSLVKTACLQHRAWRFPCPEHRTQDIRSWLCPTSSLLFQKKENQRKSTKGSCLCCSID
jgi:hypothetical protein